MAQSHKALQVKSFDSPPVVQDAEIPKSGPGSCIVQVLASQVVSYARKLYKGDLYPLELPLIAGSSAIGRVTSVGPDAARLTPGQLVLVDSGVYARDDPSEMIICGMHSGTSDGSRRLMKGEWRNSSYAEMMKAPLESVFPLNEDLLLKKRGYKVEELAYILRQLIPMGGLFEMDIKAGDRIIVAPATGAFSGAGVEVACALGANVIAAARNVDKLKEMQKQIGERVQIVKLSGNVEEDAKALQQYGEVDGYLDLSPPAAGKSTHFLACCLALKGRGKACFMGGVTDNLSLPYGLIMFKSLQLRGRYMYSREAIQKTIKLVEDGFLKLGKAGGLSVVGPFGLNEWDEAFTQAEKQTGWGVQVVISPTKR